MGSLSSFQKSEKNKKIQKPKGCRQLPYHLIHTSYSILYPPFKNSTTRIAIVLTAHSSADCPHSLNIPWAGYSGGFKTLLPIFVGSGRLEILRQINNSVKIDCIELLKFSYFCSLFRMYKLQVPTNSFKVLKQSNRNQQEHLSSKS